MKYGRFLYQGQVRYGIVDEDITLIEGNIFSNFQVTQHKINIAEVKLIAPCQPSKVVCVGLNYKGHATELNFNLPDEPVIFLKPPTAVIGPGEKIIYPMMSKQVDYEAELGLVIGREAKNIKASEAGDYILGYTCANDVTARDLQSKDGQWTRAKGFDTFMPLGPYIVTGVNPDNLSIELLLNGQVKQSSNTAQMIFNCANLVSFISQIMTLYPGDVIITGTPDGIGPMQVGDKVTVNIANIGQLENYLRL